VGSVRPAAQGPGVDNRRGAARLVARVARHLPVARPDRADPAAFRQVRSG
jgi:hypothetical protein